MYLLMSQAPNLHHIYPQNFLRGVEDIPVDAAPDSLMNICYLRARTNILISDRNPLEYFEEFKERGDFDRILGSHLIPRAFIERDNFTVEDYREFLYSRADAFCQSLKKALPDVEVTIVK